MVAGNSFLYELLGPVEGEGDLWITSPCKGFDIHNNRAMFIDEQEVRRMRTHSPITHIARQHRTQLLQSVAFTVGVGKTHLATALGHISIRRRVPTMMLRADAMFKRLNGRDRARWGQFKLT